MADVHDKSTRSYNMSRIMAKNTKPEMLVRNTFYIKKSPGYLNIKFDKEKNSEESYAKVKSVLEGINEVVR